MYGVQEYIELNQGKAERGNFYLARRELTEEGLR